MAVIAALLGWLLGQGNELLRIRREEHRAIGRALKTLILVRDHLKAVEVTTGLLKAQLNPESQQLVQFQIFAQTFIRPVAEGLMKSYDEAIDIVSGVKPLLGVRLAKRTELLPMIRRYLELAVQSEQASTLWLNLKEHVSNPSGLDRLIIELAELHGIQTRDDVQSYLKKPFNLPFDVDKMLERLSGQ